MAKNKVLVAMSGGVDSSIAAKLLLDQKFEVLGVFMRLGLNKTEDENQARKVCDFLGIKFYPVNLAGKFKKEIVNYFLNSYAQGVTPNPCIKCNQVIKFQALINLADSLGFSQIATGHYAQIISKENSYHLLIGKDKNKDQSYFLYNLNQTSLKKIIFPLGIYQKKQIKLIAKNLKLPILKSESQDICFISGDHNEFLKANLSLKPGVIKTLKGEAIGQHQGLPLYTIGQRKGVDIGGIGPLYVVKTDYLKNILYVTDNSQDPALFNSKIRVKNFNWVQDKKIDFNKTLEARTRYGQMLQKCQIKERLGNKKYLIEFDKAQRAITPGQSVVLYQGEELLGGGIIYS